MRKFSWYTIPKRMTKLETVYQYAVDRFLPVSVDKNGFGRYIHFKQGVFVDDEDGGWKRYKPNMKGGHTHNHLKNIELRLMLTKKEIKALRKILKREKKNGRN